MRKIVVPLALVVLATAFAPSTGTATKFVPLMCAESTDLTLIAVLSLAKDVAETADTEEQRMYLRALVALNIRSTGRELAFGGYVPDSIAAYEAQRRQQFPPDPEQEARRTKLNQLDTEARRVFLTGDWAPARQLLSDGDALRSDREKISDDVGANFRFLEWELEAGDLGAALRRLRATDWHDPYWPVGPAEKVAKAYARSGRDAEGIEILLETADNPYVANNTFALETLAAAIWKLAAHDRAKATMRKAAENGLAAALGNVRVALPMSVACYQLAMNDADGVVETLHRLQGLAAPIEYDPPTPRPPDLPPSHLWISGPSIKSASQRWINARNELARLLARANLEAEAVALLQQPLVNQPAMLAAIAQGQAERSYAGERRPGLIR